MSSNGHQQLIMKQGKATINKDQLAERNDPHAELSAVTDETWLKYRIPY